MIVITLISGIIFNRDERENMEVSRMQSCLIEWLFMEKSIIGICWHLT